jgi:hypothetical protein
MTPPFELALLFATKALECGPSLACCPCLNSDDAHIGVGSLTLHFLKPQMVRNGQKSVG